MGMLVDGTWFDDDPLPADRGGAFLRPDSSFRDRVSRDGGSGFKAERGRYQLVTAPSCPWAHRTVLMRALKGLDDAVPLLESDLPKGEGWAYSRGFDDLAPKNGVFHVHQVYTAARPDYTGRATVPVLWDRKTKTIVNNESSEIIRMLNSEFDEFGDPTLDLYPGAAAPVQTAPVAVRAKAAPPAPAKSNATANPVDTVTISSAAQALAQAAAKEAMETPAQTAQEARGGDTQAQRLLAKEAAEKAG